MGLFDTAKDILEAIKKFASAETQQKVIDLQAGILDLQQRVTTLQRENEELRGKLTIAGSLEFRNDCYWRATGPDRGPFCPRCWDSEKKLIHLAKTHDRNLMACNNCNHTFNLNL